MLGKIIPIPAIWQQSGMGRTDSNGGSGLATGTALIVSGITVLTVHLWARPTHTFGGVNFADVWHTQLAFWGWGLIAASLLAFGRELARSARVEKLQKSVTT